VTGSLEHLGRFMPWVDDEPQTVEQRAELLRRFRGAFDGGENFTYGILSRDERRLLGGAGLHARVGAGGLEIGYWVCADAVRQGIATEAAGVLTRVAFEVCDADRVEIRIDPANEASLEIPPRLGFPEEARLRRRLPARPGQQLRDVVVFTLFREDYDPAVAPPLRAFDALGERVL
jgi:RimJ/RimL family protein N-acetyltransferase